MQVYNFLTCVWEDKEIKLGQEEFEEELEILETLSEDQLPDYHKAWIQIIGNIKYLESEQKDG